MHFQTFRLQPPHAPPSSGDTSCSGRAWPPIRPAGLSAVLRISFTARSLISRIRPYRVCVAGLRRPSALRTIFSFPVALHIPSPVCSYFQLVAGSTTTEGLHPPMHALSQAHERGIHAASAYENWRCSNRPDISGGPTLKRHKCRAPSRSPARLATGLPSGPPVARQTGGLNPAASGFLRASWRAARLD